jgi:cystathionine gamma-synthase
MPHYDLSSINYVIDAKRRRRYVKRPLRVPSGAFPTMIKKHPETLAATALGHDDEATGAIIPPIHPSTTYLRDDDNLYRRGRMYARADNPTYDAAANTLTALEGGAATLLFSSGMAAANAVFLALDPADHVVVPRVMYWALRAWLNGFATRWGLAVEPVDAADADAVRGAIKPGRTKLVWLETPANPLWTISDIAAAAEAAHAAGARLAVDSTIATPVFTRPLSLGADIVVHAATKYLNGHSDAVIGSVTAAKTDEFWARIKSAQVQNGAIPGAFEAWLLQRGIRTLFPRVRWQAASAQTLAERLSAHPGVVEVLYPGLPGFKGHDVARTQMQGGFGGMLSIRVAGGEAAAIGTAARVTLWRRATSLGGVESLIEHRASIEGEGSPAPPDLLRLSVGLEAVEDLYDDLSEAIGQALAKAR